MESLAAAPHRRGAGIAAGAGVLLALVAAPYLLAGGLIELEVVVAQPLLRYGLAGLAALLLVLALRRRSPAPAVLCAAALLFLLGEGLHTLRLRPSPEPQPGDLRVLSHNLGSAPPGSLADWLRANRPELVLLQEVYQPQLAGWQELAGELGYATHFEVLRADAGLGNLIMSQAPLTPLPPVTAASWGRRVRYVARARITWQGQPVEVFSVHLESLPILANQRLLFGSSGLRRQQAEILAAAVAQVPHPVILAGDLNAAPLYRSVAPLRQVLDDAWDEAGWGPGFTYSRSLPLTRIDALLHRGCRAVASRVLTLTGSDHRALYTALRL
ncbi:MAG: endonuclease/exonuclease/phosphatase family protein [Candidatus Latescibacterota bacterium]